MSSAPPLQTGRVRLFIQEGGAGPNNAPVYYGSTMLTGLSNPKGDISPIREQSPDRYDTFDPIDTIKGASGLPSATIEARMSAQVSYWLRLVEKGCAFDLYLNAGECEQPSDFDGGWVSGKKLIFQKSTPTGYDVGDYGAIDEDSRAVIMEDIPFTALRIYEAGSMSAGEQGAATVSDEIVGITICDSVNCGGACGAASDGCATVFALQGENSGSPGLPPTLYYSTDGGSTWTASGITSATVGETASKVRCMGSYVLVTVGGASGGHHYARIADVVAGTATWAKVSSGYTLAAGAPRDIVVISANLAFVSGDGGYVYRLTDPTGAVTAVSSGGLTTEDLLDIAASSDGRTIVATGDNNAVVASFNAGANWSLVTGPAAAVNLTDVEVRSAKRWWVTAADGSLYFTEDAGANWSEKSFDGSGAGSANCISFVTDQVGYMSHSTAGLVARIFRTTNGGYSWVRGPEIGNFPTARTINEIAVCTANVNLIFAGGLKDANDGIIVSMV